MTGFRLLVDGALGNLSECFVSGLLFLEGLLQKRHGVFKAKLFRPSLDAGLLAAVGLQRNALTRLTSQDRQ